MFKKLITLVLLSTFILLAGLPAFAQDDEFVFGVVLVGPKDDRGWSQAHFEAGKYIEEKIPGTKMLVFESLNPADSPEVTLQDVVSLFVDEGAKLVFTTSDSFEEDTNEVAKQFPDVIFINVSGDDVLTGEAPANLGNIMAMSEWPRLIAGCASALMTETGKIGYIGPLINSETRRVSSSAYLGAKYCYENYTDKDPEAFTFEVTWIGFWFSIPGVTLDVTEETNAFFDRGFDIVMSGLDTTEMVTVANQRANEGEKVYSLAYNSKNGCEQGPESCLGVPYYHWGTAYLPIFEAVQAGTWEQSWDWITPDWDNLDDPEANVTAFNPGPALSEEALATLAEFEEELITFAKENDDAIFLWEGPLNLQDGTEYVAEGEHATLEQIWYLPQLLEGMIGASE